jgi:hypothetical protein
LYQLWWLARVQARVHQSRFCKGLLPWLNSELASLLALAFQMWADLPAANKNPSSPPADWGTIRYSAKSAYSLPDLSPASWTKFVNSFTTNSTAFNLFDFNYNKVSSPVAGIAA